MPTIQREKLTKLVSEIVHPPWLITKKTLEAIEQKSHNPEHIKHISARVTLCRILSRVGIGVRISVDALLIQTMIGLMSGADLQTTFAGLMGIRLLAHQLHLSSTGLAAKHISDLESHLLYIVHSHQHELTNFPDKSFELLSQVPAKLTSQIAAAERTGDANRETVVNLSGLIGYVFYLGLPVEGLIALLSAVVSQVTSKLYDKRIKPLQKQLTHLKQKANETALYRARTGVTATDDTHELLTKAQFETSKVRVPLNLGWYALDSFPVAFGNFFSQVNAAVNLLVGKNMSQILAYQTDNATNSMEGKIALEELAGLLRFIDTINWQLVTSEDWAQFVEQKKQSSEGSSRAELTPGLHAIDLTTFHYDREQKAVVSAALPKNFHLPSASVNTLRAPSGMGKSLLVNTVAQQLKYEGNIVLVTDTGAQSSVTELTFEQVKKAIQCISCSHFSSSLSLHEEVKRVIGTDFNLLWTYIKTYVHQNIPGLPESRQHELLNLALRPVTAKKDSGQVAALRRYISSGESTANVGAELSAQERYELKKLIEVIDFTIQNVVLHELAESQLFLADPSALIRVPLNSLSGGERSRMAMILAALHPAPYIILDEPLDLISDTAQHPTRTKAAQYTDQLAKRGKSVLIITHISREEQRTCLHTLDSFQFQLELHQDGSVSQQRITDTFSTVDKSFIQTKVQRIFEKKGKVKIAEVRNVYLESLYYLSDLVKKFEKNTTFYPESIEHIVEELFSGLVHLPSFCKNTHDYLVVGDFAEHELYEVIISLESTFNFLSALGKQVKSTELNFKLLLINRHIFDLFEHYMTLHTFPHDRGLREVFKWM